MSITDISSVAQIAASIAVVVSLIYVARQLRQNNEFLQAQARSDRYQLRAADFLLPVTHGELADAILRERTGEPLTDRDKLLLSRYAGSILLAWQHVYNEAERGLIDVGTIPVSTWRLQFHGQLPSWPGLAEFWESFRDGLEPDFTRWLQHEVVDTRPKR